MIYMNLMALNSFSNDNSNRYYCVNLNFQILPGFQYFTDISFALKRTVLVSLNVNNSGKYFTIHPHCLMLFPQNYNRKIKNSFCILRIEYYSFRCLLIPSFYSQNRIRESPGIISFRPFDPYGFSCNLNELFNFILLLAASCYDMQHLFALADILRFVLKNLLENLILNYCLHFDDKIFKIVFIRNDRISYN